LLLEFNDISLVLNSGNRVSPKQCVNSPRIYPNQKVIDG